MWFGIVLARRTRPGRIWVPDESVNPQRRGANTVSARWILGGMFKSVNIHAKNDAEIDVKLTNDTKVVQNDENMDGKSVNTQSKYGTCEPFFFVKRPL